MDLRSSVQVRASGFDGTLFIMSVRAELQHKHKNTRADSRKTIGWLERKYSLSQLFKKADSNPN